MAVLSVWERFHSLPGGVAPDRIRTPDARVPGFGQIALSGIEHEPSFSVVVFVVVIAAQRPSHSKHGSSHNDVVARDGIAALAAQDD